MMLKFWIRCTSVTVVLLVYLPVKVKMSLIRNKMLWNIEKRSVTWLTNWRDDKWEVKCRDDLSTFKAFSRLRMERFRSSWTNWSTLSTNSYVLDDLGRPDFGFSSIEPVFLNFFVHLRMREILGASFILNKGDQR